jgi:glycosyltransferase involved in cell wall biosynthesis
MEFSRKDGRDQPLTATTRSDRYHLAAGLSDTAPVRVLHLVSSGGLYGAEQVILNLAQSERLITFVGALYNVHSPNLDVIEEAEKRDLNTVVFHSQGRIDVTTVFRIIRFLREHQIDILHTHGYKSDIVGFLAALFGRAKWVATNHVWHPLSTKLRLYESVDAFALRFAARVIAVSREIREDLISTNIRSACIRVIQNGIDVDHFTQFRSPKALKATLGIHDDDLVVTIVGRLSPEKGHRTFLEAAKEITSNRNHVKFLIVGDGPMREELRAEVARLNLEDHVIFTGFRRDMPVMYALSDMMVNASTIEGLPMTILEAMASNVPVIATPAGGTPDVIKDNVTGLLFEAQDVAALKTRIESLIDDPGRRRRLAAAAYEFVAMNHSLERMCDAYGQVYREILGDRACLSS